MDQNVQVLIPSVIGGTAGFIGGAVAALVKQTTVRQVLAAVLGGLGVGTFVAPALVLWFNLLPDMAGVVGFVGGLGIFGIITGVGKIFDRIGARPELVLPSAVREHLAEDEPEPEPPPKAPKHQPGPRKGPATPKKKHTGSKEHPPVVPPAAPPHPEPPSGASEDEGIDP